MVEFSKLKMMVLSVLLISLGSTLASEITTQQNSQGQELPPMIEIPASSVGLNRMNGDPKLSDHPGLKAALQAIRYKKSSRNAYILFVGGAGTGKSATINFLFGRNLTTIGNGDTNSGNSEIIEYFANVSIPELGVQNSQLRIIDTPGLGSQEDAKILASLKDYLGNHEDLKNALPNIVLIFSKFDDNRMSGENSGFVKMLKGYDKIRDTFIPHASQATNIIYVLTRFLSETKKVQRKPADRIGLFRDTIQNYTTFPSPIIISLAENEAENEGLQRMRDDYKLPNQEFYPENLIDKISNVSTVPGGQIASAIFKSAFLNRKTLKIEKMASLKLLDRDDERVRDMKLLLEAPDFHTEVSDALKGTYDNMDPDLRKTYATSLQLLQHVLQARNIKNITQFPTKRSDIIEFLHGSNMKAAMVDLFQKAFSIDIPTYEFDLVTGHGYDLLGDESLEDTPFVLKDLKYCDLGFKIPDAMSVELVNEEINVLNFYQNTEEYLTARVRELGLQEDIKEDNYEAEFLPGYNVISKDTKVVTSVRKIRQFRLVLNDRVPLNPHFQNAIEKLSLFNINDKNSVDKWSTFFEKYGTHYVQSAFGGGEIVTTVNVAGEDLRYLRTGDSNNIRNAISKLPHNSGYSTEFENDLKDSKIIIGLNGGDTKFGGVNLAEMNSGNITVTVESWKHTLRYSPMILRSRVEIRPLSDIVKKLNDAVAVEMKKAAKALLDGTLEYIPPPSRVADDANTGVDDNEIHDDHGDSEIDAVERVPKTTTAPITKPPNPGTSNSSNCHHIVAITVTLIFSLITLGQLRHN